MPGLKPASLSDARPAKPFLKWAGGKRQLLNQFNDLYPPALKAGDIKNYYEPFLGSGAVFFDIVQRYPIKNAFLFDVNDALVLTYQVLQAKVAALTETLFMHEQKYLALNSSQRLAYYYDQRASFNEQRETDYTTDDKGVARAAQLIFLNRTCYNGLFRVNAKGAFNTPAGDYLNPCICDAENLAAVAKLLDRAIIKKAGFKQALKNARPSSFIYLDPPYRPVSKTASFTAYSNSTFGDQQQKELAAQFRQLDKKGAAVMLSNSDAADHFFDRLYKGFAIKRVPAKRLINADAAKRGHVNEIVVTNYPL